MQARLEKNVREGSKNTNNFIDTIFSGTFIVIEQKVNTNLQFVVTHLRPSPPQSYEIKPQTHEQKGGY